MLLLDVLTILLRIFSILACPIMGYLAVREYITAVKVLLTREER